jgi:Delta7-sterol 5-desaturase
MDVVLEGFDTFLFDRLYATLFPATPGAATYNAFQNVANATVSSMQEIPAAYQNKFQYKPGSKYLSFEPSSYAYSTSWPRDDIARQAVTLFLITWYVCCRTQSKRRFIVTKTNHHVSRLFGAVIYFAFASLSYVFIFDKNTFNHPKYLKNQVRLEIQQTLRSLPVMAIFTTPFFLAEVRGYSKMYDTTMDGPGLWYNYLQFPIFILFTDFFIYWIHRGEHHPRFYKHIHKPHHKWIMPTPYASHAFHPMDGFVQSIPYHVFPFIFPLQKFAYVILFVFINVWTVMIHDGEYIADSPIINGAACHTLHHLYCQYTRLLLYLGAETNIVQSTTTMVSSPLFLIVYLAAIESQMMSCSRKN